MRKTPNKLVEKYRLTKETCRIPGFPMVSDKSFGNNGLFMIIRGNECFRCMVSNGGGWDHVSVSVEDNRTTRIPTWDELCWIKDLFWEDEEEVIQYHPKKSEYVNNHPNVLHLWRPQKERIPTPPSLMVGIKGVELC